MNKIVRVAVFLLAGYMYFEMIDHTKSLMSAIGSILLVATLLISMEMVRRKRDHIFTIKSEVKEIDEMKREDFIQYIAELFKRLGYYVRPIQWDKGKGTDLLIRKGTQIICVKCGIAGESKRSLLEQLYGSMNFYHTDKSLFITNQYMDEDERDFAKANKIKIIDRDQLVNMIGQVVKKDKLKIAELKAQEI